MKKEYKYQESDINLNDLLWDLIFNWKLLIIAIFVGALIGGGIGLTKQKNGNDQPAAQKQEVLLVDENNNLITENAYTYLQEKGISMDDSENIVNSLLLAKKYEELYDDSNEYLQNSILMQLNMDNNLQVLRLNYYVDNGFEVIYPTMGEYNNCNDIINSYIQHLNSEKLINEISENLALNIEETYLQETIEVSEASDNHSFYVVIYLNDKYSAEEAAKLINNYVLGYYGEVSAKFGDYHLEEIGSEVCNISSESIQAKRAKVYADMSTYISKQTELKNRFADVKLEGYNTLLNSIETGKNIEIAVSTVEKVSVLKYIVMICIVTLGFAIIYLVGKFILKNEVDREEELEERFGLSVIGIIPNGKSKGNVIDTFLLKLRNRKKIILDEASAIKMSASIIKTFSRTKGYKKILITGCNIGDKEDIVVALQKELGQEIELIFANDIVYNIQMHEILPEVDTTILLEKAHISTFSKIRKEIEIIQYSNEILGVIFCY